MSKLVYDLNYAIINVFDTLVINIIYLSDDKITLSSNRLSGSILDGSDILERLRPYLVISKIN